MGRGRLKTLGKLITFEGTEGAGKSTVIQKIAARARDQGRGVTVTREPGGTSLAERIREVILGNEMDPLTELFLYEAARAEHLAKTILPALERGELVLCDRYTASTLAYQGAGRGLDWSFVRKVNELATAGVRPYRTVWLDIDPAKGLARASVRTRFEDEGLNFQKKVRQGFTRAYREERARWLRVSVGKRGPDEIAEIVWKGLKLGRA